MRDTWYADHRDLVKWGTAITLARRENLQLIFQVAFLRLGNRQPVHVDGKEYPLPDEVWSHFRDVNQIERLAASTGIAIQVHGELFDPANRKDYMNGVVSQLTASTKPKLVLLDPDTGIEPNNAGSNHVLISELRQVWDVLIPNDLLAVYQHAWRDAKWKDIAAERFAAACGCKNLMRCESRKLAADVIVFAAQKATIEL